jgi:nitrogen regulatory protein PII
MQLVNITDLEYLNNNMLTHKIKEQTSVKRLAFPHMVVIRIHGHGSQKFKNPILINTHIFHFL